MIADAVVLAIILFSAYLGYKRGFVRTVSKVVCLVVAIVAAKILYPYVADFVGKSFLGDLIRKYVADGYQGFVPENSPAFLQKIGDYTANGLADTAITIVSVVAIIFITYLVSKLAALLIGFVAKLPVISFFNRLAGLAAGIGFGVLICYAVVALAVFADFGGMDKWLDGSMLAIKMYNDNFLLNMIL